MTNYKNKKALTGEGFLPNDMEYPSAGFNQIRFCGSSV
jgi:hypothetical protein